VNPNLAQNLDPKLKETYDRIMGTQVNVQSPRPVAPTPQPVQQIHVPVEGVGPVSSPTPTPASTVAEPASKEEKVEMVNINTSSAAPAAKPSSSKKTSPVIFVVLGVGFFLLYTVVWLKVFKIF